MLFKNRLAVTSAVAGGAVLLSTAVAFAHVSVQKTAFAGQSQVLTFGVGHGCEGADTYKIEVQIPEEITSLRVLPSAWGDAEVKKDDAGTITSVIWSKADVRDEDDSYYEFAIRASVPNAPFTTLLFPTLQSCRDKDGKEYTTNWVAPPAEGEEQGEAEEEPAPALLILPPRSPGWNKYTVKEKITDLAAFKDAQIVWSGDAAYSANPTTMELIKGEDDVEELTEIKAGAEIWVKY